MKYNFDEVINRKNTDASKWESVGNKKYSDFLSFTTADMDFKCAPEIVEAMVKRAEHGIYGYTCMPDETYEAIISWNAKRYNSKITKDELVITHGVVPMMHFTLQAFCKAGDKVIVQNPVYTPFLESIKQNDCEILENELQLINGRYEINFEQFEKLAKDEKVKVFMLCNPHNPAGRVFTKEELTRLGKICVENNLVVFVDEIHCDVIYKPHVHVVFKDICDEFKNISITCRSISKTFNLAGFYAAHSIIPNKEIRDKIQKRVDLACSGEQNPFGALAVKVAYTKGEPWMEELLVYLKGNLDFIEDYLKINLPKVKLVKPEATYMAFLDFRAYSHLDIFKIFVEEAHVGLNVGENYGTGGKGFARICFASPRAIIKEGLDRIKKSLENK